MTNSKIPAGLLARIRMVIIEKYSHWNLDDAWYDLETHKYHFSFIFENEKKTLSISEEIWRKCLDETEKSRGDGDQLILNIIDKIFAEAKA